MSTFLQKTVVSVLCALGVFSLCSASVSAAMTPPARSYGPFASTSPDSGTCGNYWANDTFDRNFAVFLETQKPHIYNVEETFTNGTFVTNAGQSPEACGKDPGGVVGAGIPGQITQGSFGMVVTGTYNPDAVCTQTSCGTTAGFVTTVFGSGATYTIPTYSFTYVTANNGTWVDSSNGDSGDITGN